MVTLVLARHGQTDWNKKEIFKGRANIPLNPTGIKQVKALASYLSQMKGITAIYSSPLQRAIQTAEMVASYHNIKVEIATELNDFDYGEWQGLTYSIVQEKYPQLCSEWARNPQLVHMPHGENLEDVRKRTLTLVNKNINSAGTVILVSHRIVYKILICALMGLDNSHIWNVRMDLCGVTTFTYENEKFILIQHNDTCFLKPVCVIPPSDF